MVDKETREWMWIDFEYVYHNFLGNRSTGNYINLILKLLLFYEQLGCNFFNNSHSVFPFRLFRRTSRCRVCWTKGYISSRYCPYVKEVQWQVVLSNASWSVLENQWTNDSKDIKEIGQPSSYKFFFILH